jgi:hypothetical protein
VSVWPTIVNKVRGLAPSLCVLVALLTWSASAAHAADRIYWGNQFANKLYFANLDTSAGGDLATTGATVSSPLGVALDPAAGRIYWANPNANKISFANLNGSGGGDLTTTGASVSAPAGVAVDPAAGRIYWANALANKISFANLNGSGGGDLTTTGATAANPRGVAVDPAAGRIYWSNTGGNKISFANLNGSGGGDLTTTGATVNSPAGVAVDPTAGRIYWANESGNKISFANLNGTGGGDVPTLAATVNGPAFPALLQAPTAAGAPILTGGTAIGSELSCSQGTWAPDLVPSLFYRAPQSFTYSWSRDGQAIAAASGPTYAAGAAGEYRCTVSATNAAGAGAQTSAVHTVLSATPPAPRFGAKTLVSLRLTVSRIAAAGPLPVTIANGNGFGITGTLSGQTTQKVHVSSARARLVKLKATAFKVAGHATKAVRLALPQTLRPLFVRTHKLALVLTATVKDPSGRSRSVTKSVTLKLKVKHRR